MSAIAFAAPRSGFLHWLASYRRMLRFDVASARGWIGFHIVLQLILGAGIAVLYGFYLPVIPPTLAQYIVTGTPALALIPIGFVSLPNLIADQKISGTYDFMRSLPVPRSAAIASTATLFTAIALPGCAAALVISAWRYGVTIELSPLIIPALALTALVATSIGAAIGHGVRNPLLTNLISNLIIFFALMFSPIVFPPSQFPTWLVHLHQVLPFYNMVTVIRAALSHGLVSDVGRAYAVLGAWSVASIGTALFVVSRRG